jgi:hypothetical protein
LLILPLLRTIWVQLFLSLLCGTSALAEGVPTLSISEFGAKCDGHTDDAPAISRSLVAGRFRQATVTIPPSATPCMLSSFVDVPDGGRLEGVPGSAVLMAAATNVSTPTLLEVGNDAKIVGLKFDGQAQAINNEAPLIEGFRVSRVTFDHITVEHARGAGLILADSVSSSTIAHSTFRDIGNNWRISGRREDRKQGLVFCCGRANRNNASINNTFVDIGLDALQFSDQRNFRAVGNRFDLSSDQNNTLPSPDYPAALFLLRDDDGLVANNQIRGAQGNCIDAPGAKGVEISDNVIDGCGGIGIGIFSTQSYGLPFIVPDHDIIKNNVIGDVAKMAWVRQHNCHAIFVSAGKTDIIVSGNKINGPPC